MIKPLSALISKVFFAKFNVACFQTNVISGEEIIESPWPATENNPSNKIQRWTTKDTNINAINEIKMQYQRFIYSQLKTDIIFHLNWV